MDKQNFDIDNKDVFNELTTYMTSTNVYDKLTETKYNDPYFEYFPASNENEEEIKKCMSSGNSNINKLAKHIVSLDRGESGYLYDFKSLRIMSHYYHPSTPDRIMINILAANCNDKRVVLLKKLSTYTLFDEKFWFVSNSFNANLEINIKKIKMACDLQKVAIIYGHDNFWFMSQLQEHNLTDIPDVILKNISEKTISYLANSYHYEKTKK